MTPLVHGRIVLWQGGSLGMFDIPRTPGAPEKTDFHAHHAIQITMVLEGDFELHQPLGGEADHLPQQIRVRALFHKPAQGHHLVGHLRFLGSGCVSKPDPTEDRG